MTFQENLTVFITILRKETVRINRIWAQSILPPVTTMTLYFLIFGKLVGSRIDSIHGVSYMAYIVPGLIMMSVITNSYINVSSSFFSLKFQKSVEEILVSPAEYITVILGFVGGGIYRSFVVGSFVLLVALFFSEISIFSIPLLIAYVFFASMLFSLAGLMNGLMANKFDDVNVIPAFVLTPLSYLGGVFYSVEQLSPFWRGLSLVNPIYYLVSGLRYAIIGYSDGAVLYGFVALLLGNVLFLGINLHLFRRGIGLRS